MGHEDARRLPFLPALRRGARARAAEGRRARAAGLRAPATFVFYLDPKVAACTICLTDGGIVLLRARIEPAARECGCSRAGSWTAARRSATRPCARRWRRSACASASPASSTPTRRRAARWWCVVYAAEVVGGHAGGARREPRGAGVRRPRRSPGTSWRSRARALALRDYLHRFFPRVRVVRPE